MNRLRGKLTYANVVATLALFLVLAGGTAIAANGLAKNSVGTKQLKNNAVTTAKIKNGAVTGAKIQASSLGTVPSATNASHATSADTATKASTASSADSATTAGNSNLLGGVSAAGFTPSNRFAYGVASTDGAKQTLFTLAGIEVTTFASAGNIFKVSVKNLNGDQWEFGSTNNEGVSAVSPGATGSFADPKSRAMLISGVDINDTSKSIVIQCGSDNGPNLLWCFGQISPAA